jgi:hypothetical protein
MFLSEDPGLHRLASAGDRNRPNDRPRRMARGILVAELRSRGCDLRCSAGDRAALATDNDACSAESTSLHMQNVRVSPRASGKTRRNVVQMWCAQLGCSTREAFNSSRRRDLVILWSGRRDSNPRPSPWQ